MSESSSFVLYIRKVPRHILYFFIGNSEGTSYETKGTACRRGTIFFNAILHNYDHGKEKMIEERKFNLNLT